MARTSKNPAKIAYEQSRKSKGTSSITTDSFKTESKNSYENQKNKNTRSWSDIYNANSDEMSTYVHSHWKNFFNTLSGQTSINALEQNIKRDVFESLRKVLDGMFEREISFFAKVEEDYVNFINDNLGENRYSNIHEVLEYLNKRLKIALETTILGSLVTINTNVEKYRNVKKNIDYKSINNIKDPSNRAKAKEQMDKIIMQRIEQEEWANSLFKSMFDLYKFLEKELNHLVKKPDSDTYNIKGTIQNFKEIVLGILEYGKNKSLIAGTTTDTFIRDLKSSGSPVDLLEIMSNMNTSYLVNELTNPIFINSKGQATTPQLSKKIGELYETIFPIILAEVGLDVLLSGMDSKGKVNAMEMVGATYQNFNITDMVLAKIKNRKGQIINIGASLKLKADHSTNSEYVVTNLWEGKFGSDVYRTSEESSLTEKTKKYKNFINWMKNNIITLNAFSVDKNSGEGEGYEIFQRILSMEQEVATWMLIPRFFNGFLKEIKSGEYAAFDATKMSDSPPLAYTIFVIHNDKAYLTSDLIKSIKENYVGGSSSSNGYSFSTKQGGFKSSPKGWEGSRAMSALKSPGEELWKAKKQAWSNIEKVSYKALNNDMLVRSILLDINDKLRYRSLSSKIYYEINFDKL